jgi:hypothetical protein
MFDRRRYRVSSPKGPFVGYGVWDDQEQTWLTAVDLAGADALRLAAHLFVAGCPRDRPGAVRWIDPVRPARIKSEEGERSGVIAAWVRERDGWLGYVLIDKRDGG